MLGWFAEFEFRRLGIKHSLSDKNRRGTVNLMDICEVISSLLAANFRRLREWAKWAEVCGSVVGGRPLDHWLIPLQLGSQRAVQVRNQFQEVGPVCCHIGASLHVRPHEARIAKCASLAKMLQKHW